MVRVNNIEFITYTLDTVKTINDRLAAIAVEPPSLPKYLLIRDEDDIPYKITDVNTFTAGVSYTVEDLLVQVRAQPVFEFPKLNEVPVDSDLRKDLEKVFIATNTNVLEIPVGFQAMVATTIKGIERVKPADVWAEREKIINTLDRDIEKNQLEANESIQKISVLKSVIPHSATDTRVSSVQLTYTLGSSVNITIQHLFDNVVLNNMVPFAQYNTLYKVKTDLIPNKEWTEFNVTDAILLKVNSEKMYMTRALKNPFRKFISAIVAIEKEELQITYTLFYNNRNVDKTEQLKRTLSVFPHSDFKPTKEVMANMSCVFAFPNQTLRIPVWAELTMNNHAFNSLVAINESLQASKKKQDVYMHALMTGETVTLRQRNVTVKPVTFGDVELPVGASYVQVRTAKATSLQSTETLKTIVAKLMTVYTQLRDGVVVDYAQYIPDFQTPPPVKVRELQLNKHMSNSFKLKQMAPDIFIHGYARLCANIPSVVENKEDANHVMRWPIRGEATPRLYACNYPDHVYPGLRKNTLVENKGKFPYLPCCFAVDQKTKKNSKYNQYMSGKPTRVVVAEDDDEEAQEVFNTTKILQPNVLGILPKNVRNLLEAFQGDAEHKFLRRGVTRSPLSFVKAVLLGLKKINSVDDLDELAYREYFTKNHIPECATQELYDYSIDDIKVLIKTLPLNAFNAIHLLEKAFKVNIYAFDKESLIIPRHKSIYIKLKPTKRTVFIYQHTGHETDQANYPQCELIVKSKVGDPTNQVTMFDPTDPIVSGVAKAFHTFNKTYFYSKQLPMFWLPAVTFRSQSIDSFGKCRVLSIQYQNHLITAVTNVPLPPFKLPYVYSPFTRASTDMVVEFATRYNLPLMRQRQSEDENMREVDFKLGNVPATFLCEGPSITNLEISTSPLKYSDTTVFESTLGSFTHMQRSAKLLYDYAKHVFSKYIKDEKLPVETIQVNVMKEFARTRMVLRPDAEYASISTDKFNLNDNPYMEGENLIVTSEELKKRLLYKLQLDTQHHMQEMFNFHKLKVIPQYYNTVNDYSIHPTQYLFDGSDNVVRFIDNNTVAFSVIDEINVQNDNHNYYFFKNKLVDTDSVYLARNVFTFEEANDLAAGWNEYQINKPILNSSRQPVRIYAYKNRYDIQNIQNGKNDEVIVVGYRVQNKPRYTVLMKV